MKRMQFFWCMMVTALILTATHTSAQSLNTWPTSLAGLAVKSDTLFICGDIDTIHPIELGYDVPGLRLHPSYGTWSLYSISDDASPNDYAVSNVKNDGSGNAFKVVGSGIGGYLFRYEAKNLQCGLPVGDSYFMYVFIIPSLKIPISADTLVCKQAAGSSLSTTITDYFPYVELYNKANIVTTWSPATFPTIPTDTVRSVVYNSSFTVVSPDKAKGCGITGLFNFRVEVLEGNYTLDPITINLCPSDTISNLADRSPNVYFGRTNGTYSPATIGSNWGSTRSYTFSYTDCGSTPKTVVDVLEIANSPANQNWGRDTLTACRTQLASTADLYNMAMGIIPISMLPTSGTWVDRGITGTLPLTFGPSGTSIFTNPSTVDVTAAGSNIGYHFLYRMDPSLCFGGDTGLFILIVKDPFVPVDFRTQLCTDHLPYDFNLASFTGINDGLWSYVGALSTPVGAISNNILTSTQLNTMGLGTHKLTYSVDAGCGDGGVGVMYIKIGGKASIPAFISERFCKTTLPATINVNDIIGYSGYVTGTNNQWTLTNVSNGGTNVSPAALTAIRTHFSAATGVFDVTGATGDPAANLNIGAATNAAPLELTFDLTNATCIPGGGSSQLKVIIVDNIIN